MTPVDAPTLLLFAKWVASAASVAGAILNVLKKPASFALWILSNVCWVVICAVTREWAQVLMWSTYTLISTWGLIAWVKAARKGD